MDEEIAEIVREKGWFPARVEDASPPFTYTIGLMQTCSHPEFIVFGHDRVNSYVLLQQLFRDTKSGKSFEKPGIYSIEIGGDQHQVGIRQVHRTQQQLYLGFAMGFLTNICRIGELRALQAFWPDQTGKFPFEAGCDAAVANLQPRLDISLTPREIKEWERRWQ